MKMIVVDDVTPKKILSTSSVTIPPMDINKNTMIPLCEAFSPDGKLQCNVRHGHHFGQHQYWVSCNGWYALQLSDIGEDKEFSPTEYKVGDLITYQGLPVKIAEWPRRSDDFTFYGLATERP